MLDAVGSAVVVATVAAGLGSLGLAWYLGRYRGTAGAGWFMAALSAQSLWALGYGVGLLVDGGAWRAHAEALSWFGMNWTGPLFLAFTLAYTGRETVLRSWWAPALFAGSALTTVLVATHPYHDLLWRGFGVDPTFGLATASYAIQPLGYATAIVGTLAAGVGVLLLVETVLSYGSLYRREAVAVTLSPLPPTVPLLVWLAGVGPWPALNLAPAFLLAHVAFDAYAFVGTRMFETNPTTQRAAQRSALRDLDDPLFVVDDDGRVVNHNERALSTFGVERDRLPMSFEGAVGEPLREVVARGELHVDGSRDTVFATSYTPLSDASERSLGGIVVLYDITDERRRKQRLSVLNRVVRHNIRNEMTVARGWAETIGEEAGAPTASEGAAEIVAASDRLLSIARKVDEFERVQDRSAAPERVDPAAVVERAVAAVRAQVEEATVTTRDQTADETVIVDPEMLEVAVANLVENAVVHGASGTARVRVGTDDSGAVVVAVGDDNDPIPDIELSSLEGEESPLEHGQGIGLWITNWCVGAMGGELSFDYDGGNVVGVTLPVGTSE